MTAQEIMDAIKASSKPFYVYLLIKPDGTPFYVGKGSNGRIFAHIREAVTSNKRLLRLNIIKSILSKGETIDYQIAGFFDDEKEAFGFEIELIKMLGRLDNGTGILSNHSDGGEGATGYVRSLETRKKVSKAIAMLGDKHPMRNPKIAQNSSKFMKQLWKEKGKEHFALSEQGRASLSARASGQNNPAKRKEAREKMSKFHRSLGDKHHMKNPENAKRHGDSLRGRIRPDQSKWMKENAHTEKYVLARKKASAKRVGIKRPDISGFMTHLEAQKREIANRCRALIKDNKLNMKMIHGQSAVEKLEAFEIYLLSLVEKQNGFSVR